MIKTSLHVFGWILLGLWITGCSHGLQEVAMNDHQGGYVVTRDMVSSRGTAGQPHVVGIFHCQTKISSVEMAKIRETGVEQSWYRDCHSLENMPPDYNYALVSDPSIGTLLQGPVSAAVLAGGLVGMGAVWPEDSVTQNGGNASATSKARASSKAVAPKKGRR